MTMLIAPSLFAIIPLLDRWRVRVLLVLVAFAIALVPIVRHNLIQYGELSVATSRHGAWSLLLGTNQKYSGRFNLEDLALVGGQPWTAEAARIAQDEALRRISADPIAFGSLVVRKFEGLWASGEYGIWTALPDAPQATRSGLVLLSQAIYASIVVLAALAAWRIRRQALVILTLGFLSTMTLAHAFLEIMPRYHAPVVPLICILAGVQAARWLAGDETEQGSAASGH
jgi:hypothetical protein